MEFLLAIKGKDFVLLASDTLAVRSIAVMKHDHDKFKILTNHSSLAYCGEAGDTQAFAEYAQKNIQLYSIKNSKDLLPNSAACYTRRLLADALRSRKPYQVNMLLAGYDTIEKDCKLYWIDYLAAMAEVPFAAHGYGAYFIMSLLDRMYRPDLSVEEAKQLLVMCFEEVARRMVISYPSFRAQLIDQNGVQNLTLNPISIVSPVHAQ